ncbi:MAG: ATP-binding protein [Firmicutes bacterium]|nr:ATP-binding protein [Bacillota bacterium]
MDVLDILRAVYEHSLDGIVITDADTVIQDCNPAYARLCGYTREELIGRKTNVVRSGLTPRWVFEQMWRSLHETGRWVGELINRRKDGSLWVSFLSITRIDDAEGRVRAYVGIARDITERRRLEEQLQAQSTRLDALLDAMVSGVLMFDNDDRCVVANGRMTEILGVGQEALIGQPRSRLAERMRHLFREPEVLTAPTETGRRCLTTREEPPRHFTEYWAPVATAEGVVLGRLFTFRDVTREAEIDRMKSEFIATVSHELRTPMTSVKGALGLLLAGAAGEVTPAQRELLTIALNNTDRLIRLINDVLDLSRIEAGRMELHRQPVQVAAAVRSALQELEVYRVQRQIEVATEIPPDLPPVYADPDRLGQVLVNLLGNAFKFSDPGGRVTVRARTEEGMVRVEVSDTGPGIPPEDLERIFERFYRVSGPTSRKGGTGLGLAICRAIVQEHGGRIWAESRLGEGSTFIFTLPIAQAPPGNQAAGPGESPGQPAGGTVSGGG